jgi:predicted enzyme related to lactoylglutathione lyase
MKSGDNPLAGHGRLSYLEIPARDPHQSATFYEKVLGWKSQARNADDLRFSSSDGLLIGRFVTDRAVADEPGVVPFVYVDGIDAALGRATEHGGAIEKTAYAEGDVRVARVRDPAGNLIGLWQFAHG